MPKNSSEESQGTTVPALRRSVQILDLVSQSATPLSFTGIVSQLGLPKSSVHGLCAALVDEGLLIRTNDGTYRVGSRIMSWANAFLDQTDLIAEFQQLLQGRNELRGFTVTLTVLDDCQVVYIACSNSKAALGFTFSIGMRLPAPFTATGKAILSTLSDEEIGRRFADRWPESLTSHSVKSASALTTELARVRQCGYSIDNGQIREGMLCIGAPVRDFSGQAVAGLAVSLLQQEAGPQTIETVGQKLLEIAASLSARLGREVNR
ncbi:IclR family transcriptional regulator [Tatumella citrea]|uniref:IclR family transcriptional regulator n=1 Tax=Tatumella citrea TaxID=53336 RepID=A0A1Y0L9F9_TATCI|nr:IclR family transcriptional regulator [Tatumella citrea]ARU94405.1 IclR family transcriptional regulator [Tatumella citrea]ARU98444.1 IclR family transcriptional regulator [Tatumella citrea]